MSFLGLTLRMDARPSRTIQWRQNYSDKADTSVDTDSPLKPPQTELIFAGLGNIFGCNTHSFWFCLFVCFLVCVVCLVTKLCPTLVTPWSVIHQAPLSRGFPRKEYWNGLVLFIHSLIYLGCAGFSLVPGSGGYAPAEHTGVLRWLLLLQSTSSRARGLQ